MTMAKTNRSSHPAANHPEHKIGPYAGGIGVAVWLNRVETDTGTRLIRSVTISPRRYRAPETGEWKDASSYRATDLPALIFALQKAQEFCYTNAIPNQEGRRRSDGVAAWPRQLTHRKEAVMTKETPPWHALYFNPAYTAMARLVGYHGLPETVFWDRYRELCKEHGQPAFDDAVNRIIEFDTSRTPAIARLTAEAGTLCWQLLGPPPEREDAFYTHLDGTPAPRPTKDTPPPSAVAEAIARLHPTTSIPYCPFPRSPRPVSLPRQPPGKRKSAPRPVPIQRGLVTRFAPGDRRRTRTASRGRTRDRRRGERRRSRLRAVTVAATVVRLSTSRAPPPNPAHAPRRRAESDPETRVVW